MNLFNSVVYFNNYYLIIIWCFYKLQEKNYEKLKY